MRRIWPAIFLAWIAGFVDALGYLALAKVFTAHMSGNSAAVGAELGSGNWHEAMVRGLAIPGFILGIAVGVIVETLGRRSRMQAHLAPAFVLELALLVCFLAVELVSPGAGPVAGTVGYFLRVWLLALAMGIQSATLRRAGGARVRTTYISGMLTNMTENAVFYLLQYCGCSSASTQSRKPFGVRAAMFGLIFLSFLIGGICGGFGEARWGPLALFAPITGLLILVVADWFTPMH